jgi:hypothetical protein
MKFASKAKNNIIFLLYFCSVVALAQNATTEITTDSSVVTFIPLIF